ncbi:MAG: hypothetical protein JNL83_19260 [Myxococcales bacterium]|nr:hypothetical protein [Myxococcales bacterium]
MLLLLTSFGCNTDLIESPDPAPTSVRERLEDRTRLLVDGPLSGGAITAQRHVAGGAWEGGAVDLHIRNGEVLVSSDASDALTLDGLQVSFEDLQIPPGIFGSRDAKLVNVRLDLRNELRAPAQWLSDDEVHLQANLDVSLTWELLLDGAAAPLGSPKLPLVPAELVLTGTGEHVNAELSVRAEGELWSWANLVKLSELTLTLDANL